MTIRRKADWRPLEGERTASGFMKSSQKQLLNHAKAPLRLLFYQPSSYSETGCRGIQIYCTGISCTRVLYLAPIVSRLMIFQWVLEGWYKEQDERGSRHAKANIW